MNQPNTRQTSVVTSIALFLLASGGTILFVGCGSNGGGELRTAQLSTGTPIPVASGSGTPTPRPTATPTPAPTGTPGPTATPTPTPTPSPTPTLTPTATPTPTPTPTPAPTATVTVVGLNFGAPITVKSGTKVTWNNTSGAPHSVVWDNHTPTTSPDPGADIPVFSGGTSSQPWTAPTVTATTTYNYHCGIHGTMMSGSITVNP